MVCQSLRRVLRLLRSKVRDYWIGLIDVTQIASKIYLWLLISIISTDELSAWEDKFTEYEEYMTEHGERPAKTTVLGQWLIRQQKMTRRTHRTELQEQRIVRLRDAGILSQPRARREEDVSWERNLLKLTVFVHSKRKLPANNTDIGKWIRKQREKANRGGQSRRLTRLRGLGYLKKREEIKWDCMYDDITSFIQQNADVWPDTGVLASWVEKQRLKYFQGKLDNERIDKLNGIEIDWWHQHNKPTIMRALLHNARDNKTVNNWEPQEFFLRNAELALFSKEDLHRYEDVEELTIITIKRILREVPVVDQEEEEEAEEEGVEV